MTPPPFRLSPPDGRSPCTGRCQPLPGGFCGGCGRQLTEIADWLTLDPDQQAAVRQAAAARLAAHRDRP